MERLICVLVGYVFGLIQTGYIYGKKNGVDLRKKGSGNAGTTNALRTMGWKAGAVTLLGDCFKCVAAVVVVHLIYGKTHTDMMPLLSMYAGMGAVLGHNYPFYLKFKGRKRYSSDSRSDHQYYEYMDRTDLSCSIYCNCCGNQICIPWFHDGCYNLSDQCDRIWSARWIWCGKCILSA